MGSLSSSFAVSETETNERYLPNQDKMFDSEQFALEMNMLKSEEEKSRLSGETARERMCRQRRQEIDELNGLERAMEDYAKVKDVLYKLGKASSFKAEQKLLVSWHEPLAKRIEEEQKAQQRKTKKNPLRSRILLLNPEKLAIIAIHKVLNAVVPTTCGSAPFATLAADIGSAINLEVHIDRLRKHREVWDALQRSTRSELETGNRKALRRANNLAKIVLSGGQIDGGSGMINAESSSFAAMTTTESGDDDDAEWSKQDCVQIGGWVLHMLMDEAKLPPNIDSMLATDEKNETENAATAATLSAANDDDEAAFGRSPSFFTGLESCGGEDESALLDDGNDEWKSASASLDDDGVVESTTNDDDDDDASAELKRAFAHVKKRKRTNAGGGRARMQQYSHGVVQMDPGLIRKLDTEHLLTSIYHPVFKPLLVPPRKWHARPRTTKRSGQIVGGPSDGGYLLLRSQFMRTNGSKLQSRLLQRADLSRVYDALNALGETPWTVNSEVLQVVKAKWESGGGVASLPRREDFQVAEVVWPEKPEGDAATESALERWNDQREETIEKYRRAKRLTQHNSDLHSLRCDTTLKLNQACDLDGEREIYFPFNIDFRGRVYPIPAQLNHMGNDLSRGILTFSESRPLGDRGLYWLKVQLANLYGNDKCSLDERVEFVEENMSHVLESASRPLEYDWWLDADKPFQALATCFEVSRAVAHQRDRGDLESFMSSLPVHQDGSCNGLQHYAALGRDYRGGSEVNLTPRDRPSDVYSGVLDIVKTKVEAHLRGENGASEIEVTGTNGMTQQEIAGIVYDHLVRKTIKQTVMTTVYGVTFVGAKKQIYSQLRHLTEPGGELEHLSDDIMYGASGYLAQLTLNSQGELFSSANRVKQWLTSAADTVARCGQPISWMTPLGLPVVQPYRHSAKHRVKTHMQDVTLAISDETLPVSKPRQKSAFPPNYVHSLDSTHMMMTALECEKQGLTFTAVHDSYWTHASDVDQMSRVLRECFVDLHSRSLLEELRDSLVLRYPSVEFAPLPEPGELDLSEVNESQYFFN